MRAIWRQENKGKNVSLGRKGQWLHELLIFQDWALAQPGMVLQALAD